MITEIEDYFEKGCGRCARFATPNCSARRWSTGLADLRRMCRDAGLSETVKWGHPCYMHAGRNIAIIGAFKDDFRLSFFNAGLMTDPEGILDRQGPNSRPDMIRFTANQGPSDLVQLIRSYLAEAMDYAEKGIKPERQISDIELPDELVSALDEDPRLAEAFQALTPGRRKSYVIALTSTKVPATRFARIERFRDKIIAGKGATER